MTDIEICQKEIRRLRGVVRDLSDRLDSGREYLIETPPDKISIDNALIALGYDKNGFEIIE